MLHKAKPYVYAPLLALVFSTSPIAAQTQTAPTPTTTAAPPAGDPGTVTVTGKRQVAQPNVVVAAKSRILSQNTAASCNFLSDYNSNASDVVVDYLTGFNGTRIGPDGTPQPTDENGNPAPNDPTLQNFSDRSPLGDASTDSSGASFDPNNPTALNAYCSQSDLLAAAGRNYILRKDTKLKDGFAAYDAGDYPKALTLFKQAYEKIGYADAALMVGRMYLLGIGTKPDTNEAVIWLRRVAEARTEAEDFSVRFDPKNPEDMAPRGQAIILLGRIYMTGQGIAKNPAEARKWYAQGEKFNIIPAKFVLGMMFLNGYGGEKSPTQALKRLIEAAEYGYVPAQYQAGLLYYNGDDGVPEDKARAGAWFDKAAKEGHAGALYAVGQMYDRGETVAADPQKALVYYKEAALKGNADAQNAMGTYFYGGEIVPKDLVTARKWFEAAAKQGQVGAMFNLGVMYARGEGGPKDLAMAYIWFVLARAGGHENAGAALKSLESKLTDDDIARIDAILKPAPKPAAAKP